MMDCDLIKRLNSGKKRWDGYINKLNDILNRKSMYENIDIKEFTNGIPLLIVMDLLNDYIKDIINKRKINKILGTKKIRMPNFPSEISENLVRLMIKKVTNIEYDWNTDIGDLYLSDGSTYLEIKAFSSLGPLSFGPTEKWNILYVLDSIDFMQKKFRLYKVNLKNTDLEWRNVIISGSNFDKSDVKELPNNLEQLSLKELKNICKNRGITQKSKKSDLITHIRTTKIGSKFNKVKTFGSLSDKGKGGTRPHIGWSKLYHQIKKYSSVIFEGDISQLL